MQCSEDYNRKHLTGQLMVFVSCMDSAPRKYHGNKIVYVQYFCELRGVGKEVIL